MPLRTKDTPVTPEIPRGFGAVSGTRVKDKILEQKMFIALLSLLGALCQKLGAETNIYIFYYVILIINDINHFFMLLLAICISTLEKCSSFTHFLLIIFYF